MTNKKNIYQFADLATDFGFKQMRTTIQAWLNAWGQATNAFRPRRQALMRVYGMTIQDLHLEGVVENRIMKVRGEPFLIFDKNGKVDENLINMLRGGWFTDFVTYSLESIFFGYSTIELRPGDAGKMGPTNIIERACILPEDVIFLENSHDETGLYIGSDSLYSDYYIHVNQKGRNYLGLLNKAVPWTIFKRLSNIAHTTFNENFGLPMLVAKSNGDDDEKKELKSELLSLGRERVAVVDTEEDIQVMYAAAIAGASENFETLAERANSEMSKLILGHVKGTDDNQGAQTYVNQNETNKTPSEERREADMEFVANVVNDELIPRLIKFGFPLEGCRFEYLHIHLQAQARKKAKIDAGMLATILQHFEVDEKWITDNLGLPVKARSIVATSPAPQQAGKTEQNPVEKNTQKIDAPQDLKAFYGLPTSDAKNTVVDETFQLFVEAMKAWQRAIYDGTGKALNEDFIDLTFDTVWQGLKNHMTMSGFDDDFIQTLRENVYLFAGAKTHRLYEELQTSLVDEEGVRRSFQAFADLASALNITYNRHYLGTEYELAVSSAQNMQLWADFTKDGANPILQFYAVGDERTTPTCRNLNGIVRRADDALWDKYAPNNHFRCRSVLRVVSDEPETDLRTVKLPKLNKAFEHNVGKTGKPFNDAYPYISDLPADVRKELEENGKTYGK